jgi:hypothetical protein
MICDAALFYVLSCTFVQIENENQQTAVLQIDFGNMGKRGQQRTTTGGAEGKCQGRLIQICGG